MAHLAVTLAARAHGVGVTWRLDGVSLEAGASLAELAVSIAGAPTLTLDDEALTARDESGGLPLVASRGEGADGDPVRRWSVARATSGAISASHLAEPVTAEPEAATPPLELRAEGLGVSGALKCFVILPPGPDDLTFEVSWLRPPSVEDSWTAVSSLGETDGRDDVITGSGLERLGDTYVMYGDLAGTHHRDGALSTWWLTSPGIDVDAFSERLGTTYGLLADTFDAPASPYRVFLRAQPHRGASASAHPASFVMALNPDQPLGEAALFETLAHELVHEWLRLDGPDDETRWFNEGSADYYSYVVPHRAGLLDEEGFLAAVNLEAREGYASPRRGLHMREAEPLFFSDFLAHRLPYVRGMFYLADLDSRLRDATAGRATVDDVVRSVVRRRRDGERVGITEWCAAVDDLLGAEESRALDALVFTGAGRPGAGAFGAELAMEIVEVPVLDLGFDASTLIRRRVTGLVAGGTAEGAGLHDGEPVDLPSYPEIVRMNVGDRIDVGVTRDGVPTRISLPLSDLTAPVPQWSRSV